MSAVSLDDIEAAWGQIASTEGRILAGNWRFVELRAHVMAGKLLLAISHDGQRHLLVPVATSEVVLDDTRSRGVHIRRIELIDGDQRRLFLDVVCRLPHLDQLFSAIAAEMVGELSSASDSASPVCHRVLQRWREMIERERLRLLGKDQSVGLFGELHLLSELVHHSTSALEAWIGPDAGRHDFRRAATALEVKTSTSRSGRRCSIHGHEQLECPEGGKLFLAYIRLEESDIGTSLPDLVATILSSGVERCSFEEKLLRVGYDFRDTELYRHLKFKVREQRFYEIGPDFPKIVSSSFASGKLPAGIVSLQYEIELASEPPVPLPGSEVAAVLEKISGK